MVIIPFKKANVHFKQDWLLYRFYTEATLSQIIWNATLPNVLIVPVKVVSLFQIHMIHSQTAL